jgi:predicted kinase
MAASVHLVCGSTGAGKTTFAIELARRENAVRYSIDEWMTALFWMDAPPGGDFDWVMERIGRCEALIERQSLRDLADGRGVVLDLGFSRQDHRARWLSWAHGAGLSPVLWFVDAPVEVRRARTAQRNHDKGETFTLNVDDATFDWMEGHFEPPGGDEPHRLVFT